MILLQAADTDSIEGVRTSLQRAVQLEFATLPPYLYAWYTAGDNGPATSRIKAIIHEEMIHMMLACNILNSLGRVPDITGNVPTYPHTLPYSIGSHDGREFCVNLLAFSGAAIDQALTIEQPEDPLHIEDQPALDLAEQQTTYQTIGQFYGAVQQALPDDPAFTGRNQIDDSTAFAGELFAVTSRSEAVRAIDHIVSQGEGTEQGTEDSPLDFEGEVSHYYRFEEIRRNQVLVKDPKVAVGYSWGGPLGVDFARAVRAIDDPAPKDFSGNPQALELQDDCDRRFTEMVTELQRAVSGEPDRLGNAVRNMFELTQAAHAAIACPIDASGVVAGPAFRYRPELLTRGGN